MKKETPKNKIIPLTLLVVLLGLFAGIAGELIAREYMFKDLYGLPFGSEFNLSHTGLNTPNLVIKDAQKITVEQEKKIQETVDNSSRNLVGIFEKKLRKQSTSSSKNIDLENIYQIKDQVAQGFIFTSDGWIMVHDPGLDLSQTEILNDYVAITKTKEIYEIDEIKTGFKDTFWFLHLKKAQGMPVKKLAPEPEIKAGDTVLALDWEGKTYVTTIVNKDQENGIVRSSDIFSENIQLANNLEPFFDSAFIFNLKGGIVGFYEGRGNSAQSINNFRVYINNLLREDIEQIPALGLNYVNLEEVVIEQKDRDKGALIYPDANGVAVKEGSTAEEMGLQKGDVIISLNNTAVESPHQTLNYLLQQYSPEDMVTVNYIRNGEEETATAKLKGIKY